MTREEFNPGIQKLVLTLAPRAWSDNRAWAYYQAMKHLSVEAWNRIVSEGCRALERMVSPMKLLQFEVKSEKGHPPGCEKCNYDGLVRYETEWSGISYDKVCACSCEAGKWWAQKNFGPNGLKMRTADQLGISEDTVISFT